MKRTLTSIALATFFAGICMLGSSPVMAQTEQQGRSNIVEGPDSLETVTCPDAQTFTFGSGVSKFAFCISENGNIQNLESPATYKHITEREGYIVCGTGFGASYDRGSDPSLNAHGWNSPIAVEQPGGPHTFPLSITRQTTDGRFQLRQTFDWTPEEKEITITMVLKNISAAPIQNVRLGRFFDGNIDNQRQNFYDRDSDSVWGRKLLAGPNPGPRHALMLSALSLAQPHLTVVVRESDLFIYWLSCPGGLDGDSTPALATDYAGELVFNLSTINAGAAKTVKVLYRRF